MDDAALLGGKRVRELLQRHDIRLTKSLGQNFVVDPNTIRKMIAAAAIGSDDHVLEIGAGAGSLTLGLASQAAKVTAIEVDERLRPILETTIGGTRNVEMVYGDALKLDLDPYEADVVVANLPYNIAATVVIDVLENCPTVRTLTVMTQREVAERMAAPPGSKIYGRTSLLVAYDARASSAGTVSRQAFLPVPNVDSSIVRLERREPPAVDREVFKEVVKAAFSQRRKTIRNTLGPLTGASDPDAFLSDAGVDPGRRPETLSLDDFVAISRSVAQARR